MHKYECFYSRICGESGVEFFGVEREGVGLDVHKQRRRAAQFDRRDGGDRCVRHGGNHIAGTDAARPQRNVNGVGAICHADAVGRTDGSGKFRLES